MKTFMKCLLLLLCAQLSLTSCDNGKTKSITSKISSAIDDFSDDEDLSPLIKRVRKDVKAINSHYPITLKHITVNKFYFDKESNALVVVIEDLKDEGSSEDNYPAAKQLKRYIEGYMGQSVIAYFLSSSYVSAEARKYMLGAAQNDAMGSILEYSFADAAEKVYYSPKETAEALQASPEEVDFMIKDALAGFIIQTEIEKVTGPLDDGQDEAEDYQEEY